MGMAAQERRWNLDHILPVGEFDNLYSEIEKDVGEFPKYLEKVSPEMSAGDFQEVVKYDEALGIKLDRLGYMPELLEEVDVKDENARLLTKRYSDLALRCQEESLPFEHWLKGKEVNGIPRLDGDNADRLFGTIPVLEYNFQKRRRNAKYTLSEAEESIISEKNTPASQPSHNSHSFYQSTSPSEHHHSPLPPTTYQIKPSH